MTRTAQDVARHSRLLEKRAPDAVRGVCPLCRVPYALNKDNRLRHHRPCGRQRPWSPTVETMRAPSPEPSHDGGRLVLRRKREHWTSVLDYLFLTCCSAGLDDHLLMRLFSLGKTGYYTRRSVLGAPPLGRKRGFAISYEKTAVDRWVDDRVLLLELEFERVSTVAHRRGVSRQAVSSRARKLGFQTIFKRGRTRPGTTLYRQWRELERASNEVADELILRDNQRGLGYAEIAAGRRLDFDRVRSRIEALKRAGRRVRMRHVRLRTRGHEPEDVLRAVRQYGCTDVVAQRFGYKHVASLQNAVSRWKRAPDSPRRRKLRVVHAAAPGCGRHGTVEPGRSACGLDGVMVQLANEAAPGEITCRRLACRRA